MKTLLTAVALIAFAAPALAREGAPEGAASGTPVLSVRHADLDLSSDRGAERMLARLKRAVSEVCSVEGVERPSPALKRQIAACKQAALSDAVDALGATRVTTLYRAEFVQTAAFER